MSPNPNPSMRTFRLTFYSRLIEHRVQVVLECLSLAFGGTGAVRQQVETNVRIGRVVRITRNQVPVHTHILNQLPHTAWPKKPGNLRLLTN